MEDYIMKIVRKIAINSELVQKHGSILICDDQSFTGYNHHLYNRQCVAIHAEEDAINNFLLYCRKKYYADSYIRRKLKRALLITVRIKNDNIKCSAPCQNCIKLIREYGIKDIIYSELDVLNKDNIILIQKKIRDVENRPSSGYRWRARIALRN